MFKKLRVFATVHDIRKGKGDGRRNRKCMGEGNEELREKEKKLVALGSKRARKQRKKGNERLTE
jgi:hypothetical protein